MEVSLERLREDLFALAAAHGVSGEEGGAAEVAARLLKPLGETCIDRLHSVICRVCPQQEGKPHLLLQAHLDEIGLIVTYIEDNGFLRVAQCGGMDRRVLPGSSMVVHGKKELPAVVCLPPNAVEEDADKVPKIEDLYLDIGYNKEQAERLVSLGDRVTMDMPPASLLKDRVTGKAMDNRSSCAMMIEAARLIKDLAPGCGVTVLLSSMEEIGCQGARVGTFAIQPSHAVVSDVSFARTHDIPEGRGYTLGGGPMVGIAPVLSGKMAEEMKILAAGEDIPVQLEVMGGSTGTDADYVAISGTGVETILLSLPLRYMHTPVEVVDLNDLARCARLVAAYAKALGEKEAEQ